jgi:hypothetical protein
MNGLDCFVPRKADATFSACPVTGEERNNSCTGDGLNCDESPCPVIANEVKQSRHRPYMPGRLSGGRLRLDCFVVPPYNDVALTST